MDEFEEVVGRILGLFKWQEPPRDNGEAGLPCGACGGSIISGGVEFSAKKVNLLLESLLVKVEDAWDPAGNDNDGTLRLCQGCSTLPTSLLDFVRQVEDLRLTISGMRRQLGRQLILGSLGMSVRSYDGWLEALNSVEDVFPSAATRRLRRMNSKAVGTDEVVKIEEEESFEMIAGDVKVETDEGNNAEVQSVEISDIAGDAAGSTNEVKHRMASSCVSLLLANPLTTSGNVLATKNYEIPAEDSCPVTPRKRQRSTSGLETVEVGHPMQEVPFSSRRPRRAVTMRNLIRYGEVETKDDQEKSLNVKDDDSSTFADEALKSRTGLASSIGRSTGTAVDQNETRESVEDNSAAGIDEVNTSMSVGIACQLRRHLSAVRRSSPERTSKTTECINSEDNSQARTFKKDGNGSKPLPPHKTAAKCSGNSPYHCAFCPKEFRDQRFLRSHSYWHHKMEYMKEDLPDVCLVCYHLFPTPAAVDVHKEEVHKHLKCPTCGNYAANSTNLKRHIRVHNGEKPFSCSLCNKKFSEKANMESHMTHMHWAKGKKPFKCSCGKSFIWLTSLQKHKKTKGH